MANLDPIIDLTFDLTRTMRHRMICSGEKGKRMNFLQIHALAILTHRPGITMSEFAKLLQVAPASATAFVHRLVKGRWVERFHDSDNRKLVRLRLTQSGRRTFRRKAAQRRDELKRVLRLLTARERSQLLGILRHLAAVLKTPSHP